MSKKWWTLATVACGTFMATLDSSIVNVALPTMMKSLDTDLKDVKWVVVVYLLVLTCSLLPLGRISDLYGRRRIYQWGFVVFTVSSIFCGFAPNIQLLIAARMAQGFGASMLMANGPAIITRFFELGTRGKALSSLSMVVSLGLVSGPSLGGLLITFMGWRSIFLVNVPVGIIGFFLAQMYLRDENPEDTDVREIKRPSFDWGGSVLQALMILCFILCIDTPTLKLFGQTGFEFPVFILMILCIVFGFGFFTLQRQVPNPVLDISLFRVRNFWTANLANFLNFIAYASLLVLMPFYFEDVLQFQPSKVGLFMSMIPLTVFFIAPMSGYLCDRYGSKVLSICGMFTSALALTLMAGLLGKGLNDHSREWKIIVALLSVGVSSGLFQAPNNVALMSSIPNNKLGVASSVMSTIRNLGLVIGTGLATRLFTWRHHLSNDFLHSFHVALGAAAVLSFLAMVVSFRKEPEL